MAGYYQGLLGAQERLAGLEQQRRRTGLLDLQTQASQAEFEDYQKNAPFRQALQQEQLKEIQAKGPERQARMEGMDITNRSNKLKLLDTAKELFTQVGDQQGLDQANVQFEQFTGQPSPYRAKPFTPDFRERVTQDLMSIGQRLQAKELQLKYADERKIKAPPGYRPTREGNLEAIPGGPADIKAGAEALKAEKLSELATGRAAIVVRKVDDALKKIGAFGLTTTGMLGKAWGYAPGTEAYDLEKDLDTIRAQVGFRELQAMRESSPTGGALGQIAVRELDFLQAAVANLDRGQSRGQLVKNLNEVRTHFENWKKVVQQAGGGSSQYGRRDGDKLRLDASGEFTYTP